MKVGNKYWLPSNVLLGTSKRLGRQTRQLFKVQVVKQLCKKTVLVVMHHYETRKCDKVTLQIPKKVIHKHAIRIKI